MAQCRMEECKNETEGGDASGFTASLALQSADGLWMENGEVVGGKALAI